MCGIRAAPLLAQLRCPWGFHESMSWDCCPIAIGIRDVRLVILACSISVRRLTNDQFAGQLLKQGATRENDHYMKEIDL